MQMHSRQADDGPWRAPSLTLIHRLKIVWHLHYRREILTTGFRISRDSTRYADADIQDTNYKIFRYRYTRHHIIQDIIGFWGDYIKYSIDTHCPNFTLQFFTQIQFEQMLIFNGVFFREKY